MTTLSPACVCFQAVLAEVLICVYVWMCVSAWFALPLEHAASCAAARVVDMQFEAGVNSTEWYTFLEPCFTWQALHAHQTLARVWCPGQGPAI